MIAGWVISGWVPNIWSQQLFGIIHWMWKISTQSQDNHPFLLVTVRLSSGFSVTETLGMIVDLPNLTTCFLPPVLPQYVCLSTKPDTLSTMLKPSDRDTSMWWCQNTSVLMSRIILKKKQMISHFKLPLSFMMLNKTTGVKLFLSIWS